MRETDITRVRSWIRDAQRIVVLTGAGISTDSGIPDFRSPGGIWTRMAPIDYSDFIRSEEMRHEAWRRKFESDPVMRVAQRFSGYSLEEADNLRKACGKKNAP